MNKSISISDESVKGIKVELHVIVLQIKKIANFLLDKQDECVKE
jgi:hypothetical protein